MPGPWVAASRLRSGRRVGICELPDPEANVMTKLRNLTCLSALGAAALVASSCDRPATPVSPQANRPLFHEGAVPCPAAKMTGGGRIDYPPGEATKNPPASHLYETFGAHVFSEGGMDQNGNCIGLKGSLEWVDHRDEWRKYDGRPLNLHSIEIGFVERIFPGDCKDGALRWGGTLLVKNTGEVFPFTVLDCDGGEPGVGHDGFELFIPNEAAPSYAVTCPNRRSSSPPFCVLTGGNRQFHPTH